MNNKIISLELLRFISSLLVVIWHYQHFFFPYNTISPFDIINNDNEFIKLFRNSNLGTHGVYIFFCISGIVFSLTYLKKKFLQKNLFLKDLLGYIHSIY
jgi:peptidoglycan/LPS O-acetylase OafA/YrhL